MTITDKIIDGKALAKTIQEEIGEDVKAFVANGGKQPNLAAVLVGQDGASRTYVNAKVKACERCGFTSTLVNLEANISEEELLAEVRKLNTNDDVDGIIVQLPLPDHIDVDKVTLEINPKKDVDGFHPESIGKMNLGWDTYVAATPYGITQMLKRYDIETSGKHCVVIGRSDIVGTPMSVLMSRKGMDATVTIVHSRTKDLAAITKQADILIVAIGKPEFVTAEMVKDGAVVIDVGIHRIEDASAKRGFRLKGDVKFDEVAEKVAMISPVPGGVGPMTITGLLMNTFKAASLRNALDNK